MAFFAVLISTLMVCAYASMGVQALVRSPQDDTYPVGLLHNLLRAFQLLLTLPPPNERAKQCLL